MEETKDERNKILSKYLSYLETKLGHFEPRDFTLTIKMLVYSVPTSGTMSGLSFPSLRGVKYTTY